MASNLLKAGHEVAVYNRTAGKASALTELGAQAAEQISGACRGEAVITMLSNDEAVESMVFGPQGILKRLSKGAVHISSSTISVSLSERLAAAHQAAGQRYVAAPVLGRPAAAAEGKLFVLAAGAPDVVKTCQPLFDAIGQKTFVMSERPAAANLVKLSGNFLIAATIEALGEAIALIGKGGVDRQQYLEMLTATLFNAPIYQTYGSLIVEGKFEPAGFAAPLGYKDIRLGLAAADDLRVTMPFASVLRDRFLTLLAGGGDHLDWVALGGMAAKDWERKPSSFRRAKTELKHEFVKS